MSYRTSSLYARVIGLEEQVRSAYCDWYDSLYEFPADGVCLICGQDGTEHGDYQITEIGYVRLTHCAVEDGVLHAIVDGWDDMSEGGTFEWVECQGRNAAGGPCDAEYKVPDNREWD